MEGTIGEIRMFAGSYAPKDWAFCEGQLIEINSNNILFAIIGTNFGGDGVKTYALPNLQKQAPEGIKYMICVMGQFPMRD